MELNEILRDESNRRSNWDDQIKQSELNRVVEAEEMHLFIILNCTIMKDGNRWCVLYGENIQEGLCGFGKTPRIAILDFNSQWDRSL